MTDFLDNLVSTLVQRFEADMREEERCWIIQRCTQEWTCGPAPSAKWPQLKYEDWPGYDVPMTRTQMLETLELCEKLFPQHEFRGHKVSPVSSDLGKDPGSLSASPSPREPGKDFC